jgi:hypothetical protein
MTSERTAEKPDAGQESKKPRFSLRYPAGQGAQVEVAVFQFSGTGQGGGEYTTDSIVVHRSYHDGKEWKRTAGFRVSDLPVVALAVQECWRRLMEERKG